MPPSSATGKKSTQNKAVKTVIRTTTTTTSTTTTTKGSNRNLKTAAKSSVSTPRKTTTVSVMKKPVAPTAKGSATTPKRTVIRTTTTTTTTKGGKPNSKSAAKNGAPVPRKTTTVNVTKKPAASTAKSSATAPKKSTTSSTTKKPAAPKGNASAKKSTNTKASNNNRQSTPAVDDKSLELTPEEQHLQDLLGSCAYHLPNHTWREDWLQYFGNNHPLFSVCCQHPLHPISKFMRGVQLFGSIMVGLIITNAIYLLFIRDNEAATLVKLPSGGLAVPNGTSWTIVEPGNVKHAELYSEYTSFQFDPGMIILWTVGSAIHAIWDNSVWYATSCACVQSDEEWVVKAKGYCNYVVITLVIGITACATLVVMMRATVEGGGDVDTSTLTTAGTELDVETLSKKENYEFLLSYAVELAVAWLIMFPVVETIMFSGILKRMFPCLPCLGGRPAEVLAEADVERPKPK